MLPGPTGLSPRSRHAGAHQPRAGRVDRLDPRARDRCRKRARARLRHALRQSRKGPSCRNSRSAPAWCRAADRWPDCLASSAGDGSWKCCSEPTTFLAISPSAMATSIARCRTRNSTPLSRRWPILRNSPELALSRYSRSTSSNRETGGAVVPAATDAAEDDPAVRREPCGSCERVAVRSPQAAQRVHRARPVQAPPMSRRAGVHEGGSTIPCQFPEWFEQLFRFERPTNSFQLRPMSRRRHFRQSGSDPLANSRQRKEALTARRLQDFADRLRKTSHDIGGAPIGRYAKPIGLLLRQNVGKFTKIGRERRIVWERGTCNNHDKSRHLRGANSLTDCEASHRPNLPNFLDRAITSATCMSRSAPPEPRYGRPWLSQGGLSLVRPRDEVSRQGHKA